MRSRGSTLLLRAGIRLYRLGLHLLPTDFRRRYGDPILDTFRDRCREASRAGSRRLLRAQWRGLRDLLQQAAAERLSRARAWSGTAPPSDPRPREPLMLHRDLSYAARAALRRPLFAGATVLTFAIAVGISASVFSAVHGILLQPLPYVEPGKLVILGESPVDGDGDLKVTSPYVLDRIARSADSLAGVAVFRYWEGVLTGAGDARRLAGAAVSAGYLQLLGARPMLGPGFTPDAVKRAVVLSHELWQSAFRSDPAVVGRSIHLDGDPHEIVGVMPPGFESPDQYVLGHGGSELWAQLADEAGAADWRQTPDFRVARGIGRLRAGADHRRLRQELAATRASVGDEYPDWAADSTPVAEPLPEFVLDSVRPTLLLLAGAVGLLLLLACSNLMSLGLARRLDQAPELAVRAALGASRGALLCQVTLEGVILAVVGTGFGLVIATAVNRMLVDALPAGVPRVEQIRVDAAVTVTAVVCAAAVAALVAMLSSMSTLRRRLAGLVQEGPRSSPGRRAERSQALFVIAQVAAAVALLVGAVLLTRSFASLLAQDPGYRPDDVLAAQIDLPPSRYPDPADRLSLADTLAGALAGHSEVAAVGYVTSVPRHGMNDMSTAITISGVEPESGREEPWAHFRGVSPGYREAVGMTLLEGRFLQAGDGGPTTGTAAVVNRELGRRFIDDGDVLGRTLQVFGQELRIVGVVENVQYGWPGNDSVPEVYAPYQGRFTAVYLVARGRRGIESLPGLLRREIQRLDALIPVDELLSLEELVRMSVARERFMLLLAGFLATFALALAVVGVYGVISYGVARRTHEIGVRMALGADRSRVRAMILRRGLLLGLAGAAGGLLLAWLGSRLLASLLYGVEARDPLTFAGVAVGLLALSAAAAWLPARKATRVEPARALLTD